MLSSNKIEYVVAAIVSLKYMWLKKLMVDMLCKIEFDI